jgi:hypothetical protein
MGFPAAAAPALVADDVAAVDSCEDEHPTQPRATAVAPANASPMPLQCLIMPLSFCAITLQKRYEAETR